MAIYSMIYAEKRTQMGDALTQLLKLRTQPGNKIRQAILLIQDFGRQGAEVTRALALAVIRLTNFTVTAKV